MTSFADLMHDLGGEYTKLSMGAVVVNEDLAALIQDAHIKAPEEELKETISYAESFISRIKSYMVAANGILILVKPLIDQRAGSNHAIYSIKNSNDKIADLSISTLHRLRNCKLKDISESQLIEVIHSTYEDIKKMLEISKGAQDIFFTEKEKLYAIIGKPTEVAFGNGYRLLLLDDEADICEYLKSYLLKKGFNVQSAQTIQGVTELANNFKPQIALLDIKLGSHVATGIDALKFLRTNQADCKCFMLTLVDDKEILQKCKNQGAVGSLSKPIDVKEISNALYKVVREILNEA